MDLVHDDSVLVLAGDFTVRSTMSTRRAIHDHIFGCDHDIIVDLTDVTQIDRTALRVLAIATKLAEGQGRRLLLRGAGPDVRRLLHLSHLTRAVELEGASATA